MTRRILVALIALLAPVAGAAAGEPAKGPSVPEAEPTTLDYNKVCEAFGEGFTNVPGTTTCVKIGGYVKTGTSFGSRSGSLATGDWLAPPK